MTSDPVLGAGVHPRSSGEKLLLLQEGEDLQMALYLDAAVIERLRDKDPRSCLQRANRDAFLQALEGVSHFLYMAWNAGYDKPVSLLELELQAEVDKYIASAVYSGRRDASRSGRVRRMLFANPTYRAELDRAEQTRYRRANDFANVYCRRLEESYRHDYGGARMFNELRRFYRLPQAGKLRHIGIDQHSLSLG